MGWQLRLSVAPGFLSNIFVPEPFLPTLTKMISIPIPIAAEWQPIIIIKI